MELNKDFILKVTEQQEHLLTMALSMLISLNTTEDNIRFWVAHNLINVLGLCISSNKDDRTFVISRLSEIKARMESRVNQSTMN